MLRPQLLDTFRHLATDALRLTIRQRLLGTSDHFASMLVRCLEVLLEGGKLWARLFQLVDRDGVGHCLNQASIFTRSNDVKGLQPELESVLIKNVLEL